MFSGSIKQEQGISYVSLCLIVYLLFCFSFKRHCQCFSYAITSLIITSTKGDLLQVARKLVTQTKTLWYGVNLCLVLRTCINVSGVFFFFFFFWLLHK